ncbi:MAG: hypothetical protein V7L23_27415 [Nostoc sp.]
MQIELGLPLALARMFQGMSFFFLLAADMLVYNRLRVKLGIGTSTTRRK